MSLILTLTSTSSRLAVLKYTLLSLLDQKHKADKIVLCISKSPYLIDEGIKDLPEWLSYMVSQGEIEINWVENTGPYRKLIPVYRSADEDDWIVTCDDDVIYAPEWLESLVKTAQQYPSAIVCGRARRPSKNPLGIRQGYMSWPIVPLGSRGKHLLPIGIAGVLYRKNLLDKETMYSDEFKKLAPKQDDLWFHLARKLVDGEVVVCLEAGKHVFPIEAPGALSVSNTASNLPDWDKFISALSSRIMIKFKSYVGIPTCDNDVVIKNLGKFKSSLF
ncbi:glycosyltransferase [Halomonas alimentaria]|uniref:Glycosyltransferase n=1 Tax=Halomonas alimentaria TaxID=147248 RepID=A0A7X4W814_9GAMM|nr:glycosyltransferase [Halomonas alimentaria]NAW34721.1 glycosyltransferase [Halomonas alimentaria]